MREWLVIESSGKNSVITTDDDKRPRGYIPRDVAEELLGKDLGGIAWFSRSESQLMREHPEWRDLEPPGSHGEREHSACGDPFGIKAKDTEIGRLRTAIRWALGEAPDEGGLWFGELVEDAQEATLKRYWWRTHLRKLAALE